MTVRSPTTLLLLLCCSGAVSAQIPELTVSSTAQTPAASDPRATFSSSVATTSVAPILNATPIAEVPETSTLSWSNASFVEDRKGYGLTNLEISFETAVSYDSSPNTVMALLSFKGSATFEGGRKFTIEQDNVGAYFARALFVREQGVIKFLLPAMFVGGTGHQPGQTFNSVLVFQCDSDFQTCNPPHSAFSKQLKMHGRTTIAQQVGLKARDIGNNTSASATQKPLLVAGCCYGVHTGRSKCALSANACTASCDTWAAGYCEECCDAFTCDCGL